MKLNRFNIKIFLYAVSISGIGFMVFFSFFSGHLVLTRITWILIWLLLIVSLIRMLNRTNRRLTSFLQSLPYLDNLSNPDDGDVSFEELNLTFNNIIDNIKSARKDKEAQGIYFKNIVEHVSVGLISYNTRSEVKMMNRAARKLLGINVISSLRKLDEVKNGFSEDIIKLEQGEDKVFTLIINNELKRISIKKANLRVLDEDLSILSLQDIRLQLEEEELEAWQKLIRILRHEIMNSVAPINSLSNSLLKIAHKLDDKIDTGHIELLREGLEAILNRSKGMMNFVEAYKNLTSIPDPVFKEFRIGIMLKEAENLMIPQMDEKKISFSIDNPDDPLIIADYNLLTQVILNLLKNAMQAVPVGGGHISIEICRGEKGTHCIKIIDDGPGIDNDNLEKIFIPFYTTREEGSGIGLSLSRQIIRLHKGSIEVSSQPGHTEFEIRI